MDLEKSRIIVWDHKADANGAVLVTPISDQLFEILEDAKARYPRSTLVVWYQGRAVKDIGEGVQAAAIAAKIPWGRDTPGGATFRALRHSMNAFMGQLKVHPVAHQNAAGHEDFATTLSYTHLQVEDQNAPLELLSGHLPLATIVKGAVSRIARSPQGDSAERVDSRVTVVADPGRKRPLTSVRRPHTRPPNRGDLQRLND